MGHCRHLKFGTQINNSKYYPMDEKLSIREGAWSHNFGTPSINTERVKLFKFGIQIDLGKSHLMDQKYSHRGPGQGQGPNF